MLDHAIARAAGSEAERRHRRAEDATIGVPTAVARCSGSGVVGDQDRRPRDERGRRRADSAPPTALCARPAAAATTAPASAASSAPPTTTTGSIERGRQRRHSPASAWCPRSSPAPAPRSRARAAIAQPGVGRAAVVGGQLEPHGRRGVGAIRQREQALDLVSPLGAPARGVCRWPPRGCRRSRSAPGPRTAARAPRSARSDGAAPLAHSPRARSRRPMRQNPGKTAVRAALVVPDARRPPPGASPAAAAAAGVVTTSTGPCRAASAASRGWSAPRRPETPSG